MEGFNYSETLKAAGGEWGYEELDNFLANPRVAMPGTRMSFAGVRNARDRANLILFLRGLSDSPQALP